MKAAIVTNIGVENAAQKEVSIILRKKADIKKGIIIFDVKDKKELQHLAYSSQSASRVMILLSQFKLNKLEEKAKDIDFSGFISKKTRFAVRCIKTHNDAPTYDVEDAIGSKIEGKVDLDNPQVTVLAFICNTDCYVGIDISGFDLAKRPHKIFTHPHTIKGNIGFSLLSIADYKKEDVLLDCFCGDGTIAIEAALYAANISPNFYAKDKLAFEKFDFEAIDKKADRKVKVKIHCTDRSMNNVKAAEKNAKIAGVNPLINFSRIDIEWLDSKFEKESIDKIVSYPPTATEQNKSQMEKLYKEFFYQAEFILKKDGRIVLLTRTPELIEKYSEKFKVLEKAVIEQGKEILTAIVMTKFK